MSKAKPFSIDIPQAELDVLKDRLARTRWPEEVPGEPWSMGTDLKYLKQLVKAWEKYDWKKHEAELNKLPQFKAEVDGVNSHFIHIQSSNKEATPLLLVHGWPDTFVRYLKVIPLLIEEFHLVIPSLPGFGFSDKQVIPASGIADLWAKLMTDTLGYEKFMAAGGDIGGDVVLALGRQYPKLLSGIHLMDADLPDDQAQDLSPAEQKYSEYVQQWFFQNGAYAMMQSTKPQSVGVALDDSPAGLAAWILSFVATTAHKNNVEEAFGDLDLLLTNLTLYWVTRTATSAARMYQTDEQTTEAPKYIDVPTAFAVFPRDTPTPREWVERLANLKRYTKMPRGGHFAALEEPELYAKDLLAFKKDLNA